MIPAVVIGYETKNAVDETTYYSSYVSTYDAQDGATNTYEDHEGVHGVTNNGGEHRTGSGSTHRQFFGSFGINEGGTSGDRETINYTDSSTKSPGGAVEVGVTNKSYEGGFTASAKVSRRTVGTGYTYLYSTVDYDGDLDSSSSSGVTEILSRAVAVTHEGTASVIEWESTTDTGLFTSVAQTRVKVGSTKWTENPEGEVGTTTTTVEVERTTTVTESWERTTVASHTTTRDAYVGSFETFEATRAMSFETHYVCNEAGLLWAFNDAHDGPQWIGHEMASKTAHTQSILGYSTDLESVHCLTLPLTAVPTLQTTRLGVATTVTYDFRNTVPDEANSYTTTQVSSTATVTVTVTPALSTSISFGVTSVTSSTYGTRPGETVSITVPCTTTASSTVEMTTLVSSSVADEGSPRTWNAYEGIAAHTSVEIIHQLSGFTIPFTESSGGGTVLRTCRTYAYFVTTAAVYSEPGGIAFSNGYFSSSSTATNYTPTASDDYGAGGTTTGKTESGITQGVGLWRGVATIRYDFQPIFFNGDYDEPQGARPHCHAGWQFPSTNGLRARRYLSTNQELPISRNEFGCRGGVLVPMMIDGEDPWVSIDGASWTEQLGTTTEAGLMSGPIHNGLSTRGIDTALEMVQLGLTHPYSADASWMGGAPAAASGDTRANSYILPLGLHWKLLRAIDAVSTSFSTFLGPHQLSTGSLQSRGMVAFRTEEGFSISTLKVPFTPHRGFDLGPENVGENFSSPQTALRYYSVLDYVQSVTV